MLKTPLSRILLSGTLIAALVLLPASLQAAPASPAADQETPAVAGWKLALSEVASWLLDRWEGLWGEPEVDIDREPAPPQKAGCEADPDGCPESSGTATGSDSGETG